MVRSKGFVRNFLLNSSATTYLIFLNVAIFLVLLIAVSYAKFYNAGFLDVVLKNVAVSPKFFVEGKFWTLLTSMFSHFSLGHLFVNMVSLFFIGSFVERLIGRKRFVWFYLIAGLFASLCFVLLAYLGLVFTLGESLFGSIDSFAVGASGAIFGLGGLLAVLLPRLRVLVFFILPMPLWLAMTVLLLGFWILSFASGLPIGNSAHFGGLIAGLIYGFYLRTKYNKKVVLLNRMFK